MAVGGAGTTGGEAADHRVHGLVHSYKPAAMDPRFRQRLRDLGWIEDRTVAINYRWAEGQIERFSEIAVEFVRLKVDVIFTTGAGALVAKEATSVIPIVFTLAQDPIGSGLAASLARPGGNVTGLSNQQADLAGKRIEFLREFVPGFRRLAILAMSAVREPRWIWASVTSSPMIVDGGPGST